MRECEYRRDDDVSHSLTHSLTHSVSLLTSEI